MILYYIVNVLMIFFYLYLQKRYIYSTRLYYFFDYLICWCRCANMTCCILYCVRILFIIIQTNWFGDTILFKSSPHEILILFNMIMQSLPYIIRNTLCYTLYSCIHSNCISIPWIGWIEWNGLVGTRDHPMWYISDNI